MNIREKVNVAEITVQLNPTPSNCRQLRQSAALKKLWEVKSLLLTVQHTSLVAIRG